MFVCPMCNQQGPKTQILGQYCAETVGSLFLHPSVGREVCLCSLEAQCAKKEGGREVDFDLRHCRPPRCRDVCAVRTWFFLDMVVFSVGVNDAVYHHTTISMLCDIY